MKKIIVVLILASAFAGCSKDNESWITGTVMVQQSCTPNAWLVKIDNPNYHTHSFLCSEETSILSSSTFNCGNSVFILDMPQALAQDGKKVKFSKWEDKGLLCFSSTLAPHHLQVADISENK